MSRVGHRVDGLKVAKARTEIQVDGRPLNQAAFAQRLGIHPVTMNRIENGKARVSLDLLEKIADETGRARDSFLADGDEDEEESRAMLDHREVMEALHYSLGVALGVQKVGAHG